MQRPRPVRLRDHAVLAAPEDHPHKLDVSVAADGSAVVLWTDAAGAAALGPWRGDRDWRARRDPSLDDLPTAERHGRPAAVTAGRHRASGGEWTPLGEVALLDPLVQSLPDGSYLVVSRSCAWHPHGPEQNARLYSPSGRLVREGCLGDGINHVRVTGRGELFVGYADTGIFGNHGWGSPGPAPIGRSGLARFSADLVQEWEFDVDVPSIAHCETLTVDGENVWAWCYDDYFLAAMGDQGVRVWENPTRPRRVPVVRGSRSLEVPAYGARALAVQDEVVCVAGGYEHRGRNGDLWVTRLADTHLGSGLRCRLALPDGAPLPVHAQLFGLGNELNVFVGDRWLKVSVDRVMATT